MIVELEINNKKIYAFEDRALETKPIKLILDGKTIFETKKKNKLIRICPKCDGKIKTMIKNDKHIFYCICCNFEEEVDKK